MITDYDKTVLGHFHFNFCEYSSKWRRYSLLPYKTAQQTHKTRLHLLRMFQPQWFGQLILGKMIKNTLKYDICKIVATRCHSLRLKCTKIRFCCGSSVSQHSPRPPSWFKGVLLLRDRRGWEGKGTGRRRGRVGEGKGMGKGKGEDCVMTVGGWTPLCPQIFFHDPTRPSSIFRPTKTAKNCDPTVKCWITESDFKIDRMSTIGYHVGYSETIFWKLKKIIFTRLNVTQCYYTAWSTQK